MTDEEKFVRAFGKNLDRLRQQQKLSFGSLALLSGLNKANLHKTMDGKKNLTLTSLYKISKGLNIPVKELLDFPFPDEDQA